MTANIAQMIVDTAERVEREHRDHPAEAIRIGLETIADLVEHTARQQRIDDDHAAVLDTITATIGTPDVDRYVRLFGVDSLPAARRTQPLDYFDRPRR